MQAHLVSVDRIARAGKILVPALLFVATLVPAAHAQTAPDMYSRALVREQDARAATPVVPETLRAVAKSYEALVMKYPISGYADNALWQAAGIMSLVFERTTAPEARAQAERLYLWLKREYPASSLANKVDAQLALLGPAPLVPIGVSPAPSVTPLAAPPPPVPPSSTPSPSRPAPSLPASGPPASVKSITKTALPHGDRITIELSKEVAFASDRVNNPDRVFFDFANSSAPTAAVENAQAISSPLIKSLRVGHHATGVTRLVLDLAGAPRYSTFALYDPFRLVIDVEASEGQTGVRPGSDQGQTGVKPVSDQGQSPVPAGPVLEGDAPARPPLPSTLRASTAVTKPADTPVLKAAPVPSPAPPASMSGGDYSLARQLGLGVSRVVIDAGHGGHDPGAQANGIDEAELVLDVAKRLQMLLLSQPGFQVVLTRDTDAFVPLEERTAIANREGADLFLSIHANASRQPLARGIETYFLNFASNPQAQAVAARENASSGQTMGTLPGLLKAIALDNKLKESRELASMVQTTMVRRLSVPNKGIKDLGVKEAPFVVLIGAQMPSVLAEISFLTNKTEAGFLRQSSYRQRIAQALCDAILRYQGSLKKVTSVVPARQEGKGDPR